MNTIHLPRRLAITLLGHAQRTPEAEVCGLIAAKDGRPSRVIPIRNVSPEPEHFFEMDERELIDAHKDMRTRGESVFATWHSHPDGSAELSDTDIERLGPPGAAHLVISLATRGVLQLNGWRIVDGKPVALEVAVVEDEYLS